MAEKYINSLIYGEHEIPKPQRPLSQRILIPLAIVVVVALVCFGTYKFVNFREEGSVSTFLADVRGGNYGKAYANWDIAEGHYEMKDFMDDWGAGGYYGKAVPTAMVSDSNSHGTTVIVYVKFDGFKAPVAFLVDKDTLKISFSPTNKYVKTQKTVS